MTGKSRKDQIMDLLEAEPDDELLLYGLAMENASEGHDDEAVRVLARLRGIHPDYVPAYMQAGRALIRLGRDDEARETLTAGVAVARRVGDEHAAGEMAGFLESIA